MINSIILFILIFGTSIPAYGEPQTEKNCVKQTRDEAEQAIKTTWTRMAALMVLGDYEKAYEFFSNKDEMKRKMAGLTREDIKTIFGSYKSINIQSLYQDDVVEDAQCGITREEKSGIYSYPASFVRGPYNCEWHIRDF